jgi:hypothetical protein
MKDYVVLRNKNDWLNNYKGQTLNEKLQSEITRGVYEEHSKFKQEVNIKKFLENSKIPQKYQNIILRKYHTYAKISLTEQLAKKSLVSCLDPLTKEIYGLGSSSLLQHKVTGKIIDNLILDNFGLWFAGILSGTSNAGATGSLIDDANATKTVRWYQLPGINSSNFNDNASFNKSLGIKIKMGSDTATAIARSNYKIYAPLGSGPESGYLPANAGAYTGSFTIIYQGDANPTGGAGTVNEIGTFGVWADASANDITIMLARDLVTPGVMYTAGKLLRGAYTWQI